MKFYIIKLVNKQNNFFQGFLHKEYYISHDNDSVTDFYIHSYYNGSIIVKFESYSDCYNYVLDYECWFPIIRNIYDKFTDYNIYIMNCEFTMKEIQIRS